MEKDIGLLLFLQLVLPEVVPLQLMFDDVHAQGPNLEVCDQAVELGETGGENYNEEGGKRGGGGEIEKREEGKRLPFIPKVDFTKLKSYLGFQLGAVIKMTRSVTPEVVYKVNCQSQNTFSQTARPAPTHNQSNLNRFKIQIS